MTRSIFESEKVKLCLDMVMRLCQETGLVMYCTIHIANSQYNWNKRAINTRANIGKQMYVLFPSYSLQVLNRYAVKSIADIFISHQALTIGNSFTDTKLISYANQKYSWETSSDCHT